jgi:hypothetical protein
MFFFSAPHRPSLIEYTQIIRMVSSGMLRRVALVSTGVSEEFSATIIRVTKIGELGTSAVTSRVRRLLVTGNVVPSSPILVTIMMERLSSSETAVLLKATRCNIKEDCILHSHRRENLKSCIVLTAFALLRRSNVSPVRYEQGFYVPENDILHSHCRENIKFYLALTG